MCAAHLLHCSPCTAGDALSIISALFFAIQLFRTEQMSRKLPEGNALNLMAVIISTVAVASVSSAVVVHWQDAAAAASNLWHVIASGIHAMAPGDSGSDTAQPLYELLYTSFCSTDLVLLIELLALQDVSSTEAALIYSLEPVSGALMVGKANIRFAAQCLGGVWRRTSNAVTVLCFKAMPSICKHSPTVQRSTVGQHCSDCTAAQAGTLLSHSMITCRHCKPGFRGTHAHAQAQACTYSNSS